MLCLTVPSDGALLFIDRESGASTTIDGAAIPREPEGKREVRVALRRAAVVWRVWLKGRSWRRVMIDVAPGFDVRRLDRRTERRTA